jgi:putative endonuclease|tara:strand:- start:268 stop:570 length:303 start_codon:yes stop_codon:yes gene_type:complete
MEEMTYYVYMMSNKWHTVIYTGMSSDLEGRVWQHKFKEDPTSFTAKYNCNQLMWYAETDDVWAALEEEKRIKSGSRAKKIEMIEEMNPEWKDLAKEWFDD